jgi:para-aminobenzoate synthetase/4-amino-4-deoxychorismate lyase
LLSFSPELFFELNQHTLTCRPMKGTAPAALEPLDNSSRMAQLKLDPKNRAENLMIVDLMRNDLARLPQTVRVRVPSLFDVHHYGAVLQMTSAVVADLNAQPSLFEILTALFPCGSITGAPKRHTVELIDAIEPFARGAYCGAIGWVSPAPDAHKGQIQATFSVPIRTIETRAQALIGAENIQIWPLQLSVGAGITYDSNPTDEWHESLLKAGFLRQLAQPFELIETMRVHQDGRIPLLEAHLTRLKQSMTLLNWHTPLPDVNALIATTLAQSGALLQAHPFVALRLALNEQGDLSATTRAPEALSATVLFSIHPERVASTNPFLRIKSSARSLYNRAITQARANQLFDYVFLNEKNELTEGARSSIFVLLDGGWYTPPLACGLLAGVQRAQLLQQLNARTRILHTTDIARAQAIVLCNAVYGQLNARYVPPVHA